MGSGSRSLRRLALTALLALALPGIASAQPAPSSPPGDVAKAKALFEAGGRAYDRAQYDVALQAFQQAYDIAQKDGLLFSIAQTHRKLYTKSGDPAEKERAVSTYRRYVERVKSGARVSEAMRALEELGSSAQPSTSDPGVVAPPPEVKKKTRLYASSATPGVRIAVGGGPLSEPNSTVTAEVKPGKHRVRFSAPGFVDKEVEADAVENELVPVTIDLEPKPGTLSIDTTSGADISIDGRFVGEAPLTSALSLPAGRHFVVASRTGYKTRSQVVTLSRGGRSPLDLELESTVQRDASYAVLAASGAALVASGVLLGLSLGNQAEAESIRDATGQRNLTEQDLDDYESARSNRDTYAIAAGGTGAVAGVLALVGLGMFFIDPPERLNPPESDAPRAPSTPPPATPEIEAASIVVLPNGAFAAVSARF